MLALLALASLVGGGVLLTAHTTQRDADGFYASGAESLTTPTSAFVSDTIDIGDDGRPGWLFHDGRLGTVRVTATGTATEPVFVGIARQSQVDSYFRNVAYDELADFDLHPFEVTTARHTGAAHPAVPGARTFWAETASGSGRQSIAWPVQQGTWAVVVMNADGTPGVDTALSVGVKIGLLLWIGIGLLAAGGLFAAGAALIFRGRRKPPQAQRAANPSTIAPAPAGAGAAS